MSLEVVVTPVLASTQASRVAFTVAFNRPATGELFIQIGGTALPSKWEKVRQGDQAYLIYVRFVSGLVRRALLTVLRLVAVA